MFTTQNFSTTLRKSVVNFMRENHVNILPFDFLAGRSDYSSCAAAKTFWNHGFRYFTINEDNELVLHGVWDYLGPEFSGRTFEWILVSSQPGYEPKTIHYCMLTADELALVQIAYDTIGSPYFKTPDEDDIPADVIAALEASYEARRNENL